MKKDLAISVSGVYKDFKLPHEKINSIKTIVTGITKQKTGPKAFETQHALKNISFSVSKGEFFGIVGRNGSGKSTLLKILAKIYQPSKGETWIDGRLVPFIELGVGFNPELTGRENVYLNGALLGFSKKEIDQMYDDVVEFAELERFMDQKLKNYSSGMQVRLAFSVATRAKAEILLVDEVLAVGDADFQKKCFDYFRSLKKDKITVVFVTHDMNAVREYCDRAILIEDSEIIASGKPDDVANSYVRLFQGEVVPHSASEEPPKRWGDGSITYEEVKLTEKNDTQLRFSLVARSHSEKTLDDLVYGFRIRDRAGNAITGTNTVLKKVKLPPVKGGEEIKMSWLVPNVLKDGNYYFEPALVYKNGLTADWWDECLEFGILKNENTPYIINPPISFRVDNNDE